jgi:hypothetical protein
VVEAPDHVAFEVSDQGKRCELGPVVKLLSSWALVEGGTEVVLDISGYDLKHAQV